MTSQAYSKYDHTHVCVTHPDKSDGWDGAFEIVLHTGKHVWVGASHSHQGHADLIQVGIGGPTSTAYDEDGNCVLAVPATWCRYLTPEEAEWMEAAGNEDEMPSHHGRNE